MKYNKIPQNYIKKSIKHIGNTIDCNDNTIKFDKMHAKAWNIQ